MLLRRKRRGGSIDGIGRETVFGEVQRMEALQELAELAGEPGLRLGKEILGRRCVELDLTRWSCSATVASRRSTLS